MTIIQAMLLGLCSALYSAGINYVTVFNFTNVPLCTGALAGLILGDPVTGVICGGLIQPMFLAFTNAGGNVPQDKGNSTLVATAVVISTGMEPTVAITLCIPLALLLAQLVNVKKILRSYTSEEIQKAANDGNMKKVKNWSLISIIGAGLIFFIPVTLVCYMGASVLQNIDQIIPVWLMQGFNVAAKMIPAIGVAATMVMIGRKDFLPFFVFGFLICKYTAIGNMQLLVYAGLLVFFYFVISKQNLSKEDMEVFVGNEEKKNRILTNKDINNLWTRWEFYCESQNSFARLQGPAFALAMDSVLKKVYANDEESYKEAFSSHCQFYNTSGIAGGLINGIVASMEEERGMGNKEITREAINSIKVGLMGPIAGVGDTIDWSTIKIIMLALFIPYCQAGALWAPWVYFVVSSVFWYVEGNLYTKLGYKYGVEAASKILGSNLVKVVFSCAALAGYFMVGGLSASYCNVMLGLTITTQSGLVMGLQADVLDKILPGILTLITIFGVYKYLSNKGSMIKATWILLAISLVLGGLGILAV